MNKFIETVAEFHEAFEIENKAEPGIPKASPETRFSMSLNMTAMAKRAELLMECAEMFGSVSFLRLHLLQEELAELAEAMLEDDLVGCLDALCDLQYVLSGAVLSLGLQDVFDEAFAEVHRSNMSKLDEDGRPIKNEAGRVVKSSRYSKPILEPLLQK